MLSTSLCSDAGAVVWACDCCMEDVLVCWFLLQGLFMYWLTSTAFTITNSMILRIPVVRAAVGLNITRDKHETAEKANTFVESEF